MSVEKSKGRGRPKVADEPVAVTVRVDAAVVEMADGVAADLESMGLPGMRTGRGDVLRAALARGVAAMRADVDARRAAQDGGAP
ncbi:MAG: hypothetical protein RLZZ450_7626 [Pseudomonadota bacterium]|jgi:hypothetical protein